MAKTSPNAKCSCGSGKKFKVCCGSPDAVNKKTTYRLLVILLAIAVTGGVYWARKRNQQHVEVQRAMTKNVMQQLGLAIHVFSDSNPWRAFPTLETRDQLPTELLQEIENRAIVIRWDSMPATWSEVRESDQNPEDIIIAHEKDANQQGGYALFLDARVDELTVDEFAEILKKN